MVNKNSEVRTMAKTLEELAPGEEPAHDEALTKDNWSGYFNNSIAQDEIFLFGHLEGSDRITSTLEKMVHKATTFDELKADLLNFIQSQKEMRDDIDEKYHSDEPQKWGMNGPAR
jgi:hypothetical protein